MSDEARSMIADAAGRLFADVDRRSGFDQALWNRCVESGLLRLLCDEALGGAGFVPIEASEMCRQFGLAAPSVPLPDRLLAGWLLTLSTTSQRGGLADAQCFDAPMPVLISDRRTLVEIDANAQSARVAGWVGQGRVAEHWLLLQPPKPGQSTPARMACVRRPQIQAPALSHGNAPTEAVLAIHDMHLPQTQHCELVAPVVELTEPAYVERIWPMAALLSASTLLGAMQKSLDLALAHANLRVQFGRAIGQFQAVQHMLALAAEDVAASAAAVDWAAMRLSEGTNRQSWVACAIAKARSAEAAGKVAAVVHQVHGAIAFTEEYELHHRSRLAWNWRDRWGDEALCNQQIGLMALEAGSAGLFDLIIGRDHGPKQDAA